MSVQRTERSARSFLIEGFVIVISILLAFAIDAGWDEMREREQEQRLLTQLRGELDKYLEVIGPQAKRFSDASGADTLWLIEAIHGESAHSPEEWLDRIARLDGAYQFAAATPVFDRLAGDRGFQLVSDPEIREVLASVASFLSLVRRFEQLHGQFLNQQLIPWLNQNIDQYAVLRQTDESWHDSPLSRFEVGEGALRSREFSNLLIERRRGLYLVTLFRGEALARVEELRALISSESGS